MNSCNYLGVFQIRLKILPSPYWGQNCQAEPSFDVRMVWQRSCLNFGLYWSVFVFYCRFAKSFLTNAIKCVLKHHRLVVRPASRRRKFIFILLRAVHERRPQKIAKNWLPLSAKCRQWLNPLGNVQISYDGFLSNFRPLPFLWRFQPTPSPVYRK